MWKRKIHSQLSVILRRSLPSSRLSVASSTSGLSITNSFGSLCGEEEEEEKNTSRFRRFHFLIRNQSFGSQSVQRVADRCWNCSWVAHTAPFLACDNCRTVQPVDPSVDYFQIFGLERKYDIEEENLEGKYKDWQKKLHPDLVHSKSEREKEYAAEQSARVIDAYRTLGNPLARAIYIMKLEGVDWDEEQTISEPELLAEIMEVREAVEETTNSQALNQIQVQIQEKLKCWSEYFATSFQRQKYEEACTSILRMTYYMRINEEIVKKL